ncbi:tRNA (guanine-N(7)-)-methyltransferase non-catalytic subunit wuho [Culicoides brevitarsis]|uniref:tRNA (guanine-N(7)-)-methyltransferase non-catalytic subunit wuho n=1 Tax=Culicoides brevitarsis TaxID=469753 RepID=UPI00307C0EC6
MSLLSLKGNILLIGTGTKLLFLHMNHETKSVDLHRLHDVNKDAPLIPAKPIKLAVDEEDAKTEGTEMENGGSEPTLEFRIGMILASRNSKFLAVAMTDKTLYLYDVLPDAINLRSRRKIARNASAMSFFPDSSSLLVADKTGDVFVFDCIDAESPGKWIQGHISQVLDIQMNKEMDFFVTSDRDEKIKVVKWPEHCEIEAFCLGHKEFVSSIEFFELGEKEWLVSGSGDASLRIWDYTKGECAHEIKTKSPVGKLFVVPGDYSERVLIAALLRRPDQIEFIEVTRDAEGKWGHTTMHVMECVADHFLVSVTFDSDGQHFTILFKTKDEKLHLKQIIVTTFKEVKLETVEQLLQTDFKDFRIHYEDALESFYKKAVASVDQYVEKKRKRIEEENAKKEKRT